MTMDIGNFFLLKSEKIGRVFALFSLCFECKVIGGVRVGESEGKEREKRKKRERARRRGRE